jgi:transcription elongation GreA/GreB family factor
MSGNPETEDAVQSEPSGLFSGKVPIEVALNELRLRLLDMTGRNRLVNFKHSPGKSLQFVHSTIDGVFTRLTYQNNRVPITPLPEPEKSEWVQKNGRLARPDPKEWAGRLGISTGYILADVRTGARQQTYPISGADLRTLYYAEDLGKHCRKLEREAKLAIEETGANMLYLVAGFLEFPEAPDSEKLYQAPLLCIPVSMTRVDEGQYSSFYLNHTGEEISDNLSLREKLKRDYVFNLPEFDPEGDESAEAYLKRVTKAVERQPNWSVKPMLTLTLLSFTNMLLVRDLDPSKWRQEGLFNSLVEHPLVRQVFEGKPSSGDTQYADEYSIDDHPKGDLPLIFDADSSQHSALIDVIEGHSRVIEGPPGTGKSQTITNLIAAALQAGKKILFVAEKLAALEVVKSRLNQARLSPFILELHSNKTSKKRVLEDLAARIGMLIPQVNELPDLLARHEEKRKELKAYADLMNTKVGNHLDLTLHQVMWRAERHRLQAGTSAEAVQELDYFAAPRTSPILFADICDRLRVLATQLGWIGSYGPEHPLWGFFPRELSPEQDLSVQRVLKDYAQRFDAFSKAAHSAADFLGGSQLNMSAKEAEGLLAILDNIAPASADEVDFSSLPSLFPDADQAGRRSLAILQTMQTQLSRIEELNKQIALCLVGHQPVHADTLAAAKKCVEDSRVFGFENISWANLSPTSQRLTVVTKLAEDALRRLRQAAESAGLPLTDQVTDLNVLKLASEVAEEAPLEVLNYRHAGLDSPIAVKKLTEGLRKSEQIRDIKAKADALMYMDAVPSDSEIAEAIRTFREGDAWYRIFQGRWRKAKRLHQTLSRNKAKRTGADSLKDLELLVQLQTFRNEFQSDHGLKEVSGAWFEAEKTPFNELLRVAAWLSKARARIEAAGVRPEAFDPLTVKRSILEALRKESAEIGQRMDVLSQLHAECAEVLKDALPRVLKSVDSPAWNLRVETWGFAASTALAGHEFAKAHLRSGTSLNQGLAAFQASLESPRLEEDLQASEAAKALVGARFCGSGTDLSPLFAAHTYGSLIKKAGLPKAIESVLISEHCAANYVLLKQYTEGINQGWQDSIDFAKAMASFGQFESALWVDPINKVSSAYATELAAKTQKAADSLGGLLSWVQYIAARQQAQMLGLDGFVSGLESGGVAPDKLVHSFTYRFYAAIAKGVFDRVPALKQFSGARHTSVRKEFAELDKQIIELRGLQVARSCRTQSRPPVGQHGVRVDDKTEMKLLEHLIPQQRPRVPVRQIMRRAGQAIQELKPCFMMGPQAVAQFLEPGRFQFDIIVMDEASQLRPEQAIGAIARGSQLVVVGDPKQLPPTSFFSRMSVADGDGDDGIGQLATSDAESILDVCIAHFQPVRSLRWHYRSRHESLIAFSNHHFYRGNLVVFPSPFPKGKSLGLSYHYVREGVYENQMNHVEARRVVDAAVDHILHRPDDSLGIVTLNIKQRDLVAELLEERLRNIPQAVHFKDKWESEGMGLFVKNLENVQGDERDCILISTTFGKAKGTDVVRQNFGPISREGGWRRLNVLFTRARKAVAVHSSMRPEDIVSDGRTPEGTRALRNYLEFARDGVLPVDRETGLPPDSDFEIAVMDVLWNKGYEVTPQFGVAGFRIDIAVRHPRNLSGYLAAVECDGASYHSGVSVRDRDRIRQEILESLGWRNKIWRIWSTDWFRNPLSETQRMLQFLEELQGQAAYEPVAEEPVLSRNATENAGHYAPTDTAESSGQSELTLEEVESDVLVFDEDEEDLEVDIGDLVTFASKESPDQEMQARITARQTDPAMGLVAHNTPLGEVLMGATVGEIVVLRVPGRPPQSFVIKAVKRDDS